MQTGDKDPQLRYLESMIKNLVSPKHETLCSIDIKGHVAIVTLMAKLDSHFAALSPYQYPHYHHYSRTLLSDALLHQHSVSLFLFLPPLFFFSVSTASLLFIPLLLLFFPPFSY